MHPVEQLFRHFPDLAYLVFKTPGLVSLPAKQTSPTQAFMQDVQLQENFWLFSPSLLPLFDRVSGADVRRGSKSSAFCISATHSPSRHLSHFTSDDSGITVH